MSVVVAVLVSIPDRQAGSATRAAWWSWQSCPALACRREGDFSGLSATANLATLPPLLGLPVASGLIVLCPSIIKASRFSLFSLFSLSIYWR
jgi:hypothetical protein